MSQSCREFRERWLERDVRMDALEDAFSAHLAGCSACAEFAQRHERLQRALSTLDRLRAPDELPGRVVAASNAGYRQERAASALGAIGRLEPPTELERKVLGEEQLDEQGRLRAPRVLERLVHEELHDPSKALSRRFARRLRRLEAPAELERRVAAELARPAGVNEPERRLAWRVGIASALLVFVFAISVWLETRTTTQHEPEIVFRIEHVRSAAELDPAARELIGGLSGGVGAWSAERPR